MRRLLRISVLAALVSTVTGQPHLVVLTGSGEERDGLPALTRHPEADSIELRLDSGFPKHILRLYRFIQNFRRSKDGVEIEPAYLYLSENQGGFPRYGFFLDGEPKPGVAYVDLHKSSPITGRFGAVDQIFPHELGHVFIRQLVGELGDGGANQIHSTALRTDRTVAFNEGFAEHFQIMTLDSPEAPPETARLAADHDARARTAAKLDRYRRALEALWSPGAPARMRFLLWFSGAEDVLRYDWVKANAFSRQPRIDDRLLTSDPYRAYLIEAVLPGGLEDPAKPPSILVSTEGTISALFHRWVTNPEIQSLRPGPEFFAQFDAADEEVTPLENAYLKLFEVFALEKPQDVLGVVAGYKRRFPEEVESIDKIVDEVFLGQAWPSAPEIWLANERFKTGTTLFDQYRGLPRTHTFDLNAASRVDLMGVPGMSLEIAKRIESAAPYSSLDQLTAVEGVSAELLATFQSMERAMRTLRSSQEEQEGDLSLSSILNPYIRRALLILGVCWLLAAVLYRAVRRTAWWRCVLNGLAASLLLLATAWFPEGWTIWKSFFAPILLFGVPAGLWQLARNRRWGPTARVLAAWVAAALPAALSVQTWNGHLPPLF